MKKILIGLMLVLIAAGTQAATIYKPWKNGKLKVSDNQRYLVHENGQPFFWMHPAITLRVSCMRRSEPCCPCRTGTA